MKKYISVIILLLLSGALAQAQGFIGKIKGTFKSSKKDGIEKTIDTEETTSILRSQTYSVGDYIPIQDDDKWGYQQFGEWVIKPRFDVAGDFRDGLAPVSIGEKWGYIEKSGLCAIPYRYESAGLFVDGLANVKLTGKWGFIDKSGVLVIPYKYSRADSFNNGLAKVTFDGKDGYIDKTGQWFDSADEVMQSFSSFARHRIEADINQWQKKGKYEKISQWQARVTDKNRQIRIDSLLNTVKQEFIISEGRKIKQEYSIVDYDSESEVFLINDKRFGNLLVPVPIQDAEYFEKTIKDIKREDVYYIDGEVIGLQEASFRTPDGNSYKYNNTASLSYTSIDIDYDFDVVNFEDTSTPINSGKQILASKNMKVGLSDVDKGIPETDFINDKTFALILTNENYAFVSHVPFANNDGKVFEEYCIKTLGLPKENIHRTQDATYGQMMREVGWISDIAKAFKGQARILVYYAGHGIPDESTRDAYLLPTDGAGNDVRTAIKLSNVYSKLNENPTVSTVVFLDACFSGSQRNGEMLAQARGVAIKPKTERPEGNMVVFSAASGDETAYPYDDKAHGLFSYFLLKRLQETCGEATLGDLAAFIGENVSKQSIIQNAKSQTPTVVPSDEYGDDWKSLTLK